MVFQNHNSTFDDNCKFLPFTLRMELKVCRHGFTKRMKCLTAIKKETIISEKSHIKLHKGTDGNVKRLHSC